MTSRCRYMLMTVPLGLSSVTVVLEGRGDPRLTGWSWPRHWPERLPLLESQHDRLESLIQELLHVHRAAQHAWSLEEALAVEASCRRLLWDLRLHLRLEERWLSQCHCMCPGHRARHAEALKQVTEGLLSSAGNRVARQRWLEDLQVWFVEHRQGPDAMAYAHASAAEQ